MDSNSEQQSGNVPPAKPWERAGAASSGPTPFKPPSPGSTSDVVEASRTAIPDEVVSTSEANTGLNRNSIGRPLPTRPWEQQTYRGSMYGGYGSDQSYNSGYGSGMYGSSYGLLYGELARFVLRLLGIKTKPRKVERLGTHGLPAPHNPRGNQNYIEGSKAAPNGAWDNVWGNNASG